MFMIPICNNKLYGHLYRVFGYNSHACCISLILSSIAYEITWGQVCITDIGVTGDITPVVKQRDDQFTLFFCFVLTKVT